MFLRTTFQKFDTKKQTSGEAGTGEGTGGTGGGGGGPP